MNANKNLSLNDKSVLGCLEIPFWTNEVDIMAGDAMAPYVTRSSASAMALEKNWAL